MNILIPLLFIIPFKRPQFPDPGNLMFGMRSTISLFSSDGVNFGSGAGGQFRLQLGQRLNTEWFADLITADISNAGRRVDGHIGWSVMFYPTEVKRFRPYILGGHCFDYTRIQAYSSTVYNNSDQDASRWSSAVHLGVGSHVTLTHRCDLSLTAQYMMHLGKDVHAHVENNAGLNVLKIEEHKGAGVEGHLLVTVSVNYAIADLW